MIGESESATTALFTRSMTDGLAAGDAVEKSKGFGIRMSLALVEHIGATLKVERHSPGTEFLLDIPL